MQHHCKAFLALVMAGFAAPSQAEGLRFTGETGPVSRFVDDDLLVYTNGPAIQSSFVLEHDSGLYAEVWSTVGLGQSESDEVDLMIGYETDISDKISFSGYVGYYLFRDNSRAVAIAGGVASGGAAINFEYLIPTSGGAEGFRVTGVYTKEWEKFSLAPSVTYDNGSFNGVTAIVTAGIKAEYEVTEDLTVSVSGRIPLINKDLDQRNAQVVAAVIFRF